MKTLDEIKNDVCLEYGYYTYSIAVSDFKQGRMDAKTFNCIVKDIAREVAKEALKNASDNAKCTFDRETINDSDGDSQIIVQSIDKQSILNESNIPKL